MTSSPASHDRRGTSSHCRTGLGHGWFGPLHIFHRQDVHDFVGITAPAQQVGHDAHGPVDVVEEQLVSSAQVVQPWLAVGGMEEVVIQAFALAGRQPLAFAAVTIYLQDYLNTRS